MKLSLSLPLICLALGNLCAGGFKIHKYQKFTVPVKDIYKEKIVHYLVPDNYKEKKLPLLVLLHGGGAGTPVKAPLGLLQRDVKKDHWGGICLKSGAVVAAPHCFFRHSRGWNHKDTGGYIGSVIAECVKRYNIDPERVYLLGWSMGGMGAYYAMVNYPELFAGIAAGAGTAHNAQDFKNIGNAKAYLIHGRNDAVYKKRPHFTDIQCPLLISKLMTRDKINHMLLINDQGHSAFGHKKSILKFWDDARKLKRDLSRVYISGNIRNRAWITVDKFRPGKITVDYIAYGGGERGNRKWDFSKKAFDSFKMITRKVKINGGRVDAVYSGNNQFNIKTENIAVLTVRMNGKMVDYSRPVKIIVNGEKVFSGMVKPDKKAAGVYAHQHILPGVFYNGKVTVKLTGKFAKT